MSKWNKYEIPENNLGSSRIENIETKQIICDDMIMEDRPMFSAGRYAGNIESDIIIDFDHISIDTHNAYKNGIWACPKDGLYSIDAILLTQAYEDGTLYIKVFKGKDLIVTQFRKEVNLTDESSIAVTINTKKYIKAGEVVYLKTDGCTSNFKVYGNNGLHTNISITYLG